MPASAAPADAALQSARRVRRAQRSGLWGGPELLLALWALEVLGLLVLHERSFVLKLPLRAAVPAAPAHTSATRAVHAARGEPVLGNELAAPAAPRVMTWCTRATPTSLLGHNLSSWNRATAALAVLRNKRTSMRHRCGGCAPHFLQARSAARQWPCSISAVSHMPKRQHRPHRTAWSARERPSRRLRTQRTLARLIRPTRRARPPHGPRASTHHQGLSSLFFLRPILPRSSRCAGSRR